MFVSDDWVYGHFDLAAYWKVGLSCQFVSQLGYQ